MDKKIKFNYLPSVSIDDVKRIAEEYFPECQIKLQTWGINSPFVIIRKGFFVRAMVFIKQKENKGQTIIGINGGLDPFAAALFGFIFHYVLRGDFLSQIQEAIENGIKEKYNVSTIS